MKIHHALSLLAAASLLAACSDGPGPEVVAPPPAPPEVPASALLSSAAYTAYVASLAATKTETGGPVGLTLVTGKAPSSETEAPATVAL